MRYKTCDWNSNSRYTLKRVEKAPERHTLNCVMSKSDLRNIVLILASELVFWPVSFMAVPVAVFGCMASAAPLKTHYGIFLPAFGAVSIVG